MLIKLLGLIPWRSRARRSTGTPLPAEMVRFHSALSSYLMERLARISQATKTYGGKAYQECLPLQMRLRQSFPFQRYMELNG